MQEKSHNQQDATVTVTLWQVMPISFTWREVRFLPINHTKRLQTHAFYFTKTVKYKNTTRILKISYLIMKSQFNKVLKTIRLLHYAYGVPVEDFLNVC
jgi:hypothetical protein